MKRFIVIHHSLTADGNTVNWQAIRNYHVNEKGWDDVGYHFGVEKIGHRYEVLLGRTPDSEGAHCREMGMNTLGIGICLVGNFDVAPPTNDNLFPALLLCAWLCKEYDIPVHNILGHREVGQLAGFDWRKDQYKSCPGKLFSMEDFRASVQQMLTP